MKLNCCELLLLALCAFQGTNAFLAPVSIKGGQTALSAVATQTGTTKATEERMGSLMKKLDAMEKRMGSIKKRGRATQDDTRISDQYTMPISDQDRIWGTTSRTPSYNDNDQWYHEVRPSFQQGPRMEAVLPKKAPTVTRSDSRRSFQEATPGSRGYGNSEDTWYHDHKSNYDQYGGRGYENRHRTRAYY